MEAILHIARAESTAPFITKDGSEIREFFNPRITPGCRNLSLAEATLQPGQTTAAHRHPQAEEIYCFLRGTGYLRIGDEAREVTAGDMALIPADTVHECRNTGGSPLVFLCHCAPAYTHEDTLLA